MSNALWSHSTFKHAIFLFWNPQHIPCSVTGIGDPSEHMFVSHNNNPKQSLCKIWQNLKILLNLTRIQSIPNGWRWSNYWPKHIHKELFLRILNPTSTTYFWFMFFQITVLYKTFAKWNRIPTKYKKIQEILLHPQLLNNDPIMDLQTFTNRSSWNRLTQNPNHFPCSCLFHTTQSYTKPLQNGAES